MEKKKRSVRRTIQTGIFLTVAVLTVGMLIVQAEQLIKERERKEFRSRQLAVFSWESDGIDDKREEIFSVIKEVNADTVYQTIPSDADMDTVKSYLKQASQEDLYVYMLAGNPKWALKNSAKPYVKVLKQAAEYNEVVEKEEAIQGVIYDIEPYVLAQWKQKKKKLMKNYVKAMKKVYEEADKYNLRIVICIPYFFDDFGMKSQLKQLIAECCDEVAVMNYYQDKEISHIKTEASYAKKYEKPLVTIYEFNPPGTYDLIEKNTYYDDGIDAAISNYEKLKERYDEQEVLMGMHDVKMLGEMLKK